MIVITGDNAFTLVHEHKNGWNAEAFKERYSDVLDRYDYIVGDWGYSQLRLRGFFREGHPRATKETTIANLTDYINEYCNFGCAYFVLSKTEAGALPPGTELSEAVTVTAETDSDTAAAASSEAAAQTAETAAAAGGNGMLMRWPLKERPGGPVRVPGASAVARAAAEAERRSQQAAANAKPVDARPSRQGADGGFGGRQGGRPYDKSAADKRSSGGPIAAGGAADGRSGGKAAQGQRGPRPQGGERFGGGMSSRPHGQQGRNAEPGRSAESARSPEAGQDRSDGAKNGSRWPGKNRRRSQRFGGKPTRPDGGPRDGGESRSDSGNPGAE